MKYKKTSSFLMSILMLFSAIVLVAASGGIGGVFTDDTSVIYGSSSTDLNAATSMQTYLETFGPLSLNTTIISGELAPIKTSSQPLYLNDDMRITKSIFTDNELPTVLASGEVDNFDYDLKIEVPNTKVVYDTTSDDFDTPIINANFDNGGTYSFKVIFPVAIGMNDLKGESIVLFGEKYQFSDDSGDLSVSELILYQDREVKYISEGTTETVNGKSIDVLVKSKDSARLTINGESKTVDKGWSGTIGGMDVTVKDITYQDFAGGIRLVDLYIDSQKLVLSNNNEVELGSESLDGTNVVITNSGEKIREIVITATPGKFDNEVEYLKLGDNFIDPIFGTVKFSLDTITPELKSDEKDFIEIKTSGDDAAKISFINKAGGEYDFEFINNNLITFSNTNTVLEDGYFITGNKEYTQIWKVEDIKLSTSGTTISKTIKLRDMAKGSDYIEVKFDDNDGDFTLADGSVAIVTYVDGTKVNISSQVDYLYTDNGAIIKFDFGMVNIELCSNYSPNTVNLSSCVLGPVIYTDSNTTNVTVGEFYTCQDYPTNVVNPDNCSIQTTSITASKIIISEDTEYNDGNFKNNLNNNLGSDITISIENLNEPTKDLALKLEGSGFVDDDENKYLLTSYGTYMKEADGDKVEIYYPSKAMEIDFNIGEIESKVTKVSEGLIISKITDNTASTSSDKNIIVVGGPCINSVAAQLLGGKTCGSEFTTATSVGEGQALIQIFTNPFNSNGKAILVAGYEVADTSRAIEYLKSNQIDLSIGTKIII